MAKRTRCSMKKKLFQTLWAGIAAISVTLSAQNDQDLFDVSIKQVDTGGVYLNYVNTQGMAESLDKLRTFVINSSQSFDPNELQMALIQEGSKVLLNLIHLASYQAQAISAVAQDDIFFYKNFLYTGTNKPQGIGFDLFSRINKPLTTLNMIPKNARLAIGGHLEPEAVWNTFSSELRKSENDTIKQLPTMLEGQAEQRLKTTLPQLLKSICGEYFLLVTSSGTAKEPIINAMLALPDQDGTLQKVLMEQLVPSLTKISENVYAIPRNNKMPNWLTPQLIFEKNQVRIISNPTVLTEINTALASGGALKSEELSKYTRNLPQTGLNYFYLNIDKITTEAIAKQAKSNMIAFIFQNKQPVMFGVTTIEEHGYKGQFTSNVSIHDSGVIAPAIMAGMLLPALNSARERARRIACISNAKQFGLALKHYAMDNKDQFPTSDNLEGLNELKDKGYIPEIFQCPSAPKNGFNYYYLGGFKEGDASNIPLIFDRPGNHSNYVNVLFLDGHVEGIIIKDYQHPTQVVQLLIQNKKYAPELQAKLLEKCKEL